jgi:cytochrome c-type biogenesis protein CcsB
MESQHQSKSRANAQGACSLGIFDHFDRRWIRASSRILTALGFLLTFCLSSSRAFASDDFADQIDLSPLRIVAVQNNQVVKTLDSFARQAIKAITSHSSLDGHEPVYTLLDMSFRPERYVQRNIIKVANVPLREEFQALKSIDDAEQQRILKEGTVSLAFMQREDVGNLLETVQSKSVAKSKAINELIAAAMAMRIVCQQDAGMIPGAVIAPATKSPEDRIWHPLRDMLGASPAVLEALRNATIAPPAVPEHYEDRGPLFDKIVANMQDLDEAWTNEGWTSGNVDQMKKNVDQINRSAAALGDLLPQVNPAVYPTHAKRIVEVMYNRWMMLTIPGAAFYFIAFVLFLLSAQAGVGSLRLWGIRFMVIALLVHTTGIGVRWWLVGDIFPPIKNEFESVMFSAWFGAIVGLILELRRSRGIFGAASSFIGMLSLMAIFTVPFITHTEIGGEIMPVQGVLMSYWLYIHVTMVTAAYALIGMGFVLSSWWLIRYYRDNGTLSRGTLSRGTLSRGTLSRGTSRRAPGNLISAEGAGNAAIASMQGGTAALGFGRTLAMTFFIPGQNTAAAIASKEAVAGSAVDSLESSQKFLATLDMCNLVVLQLAFWVLGTGVVLGAIWADQSWGRPWGWDPKETFALVTWLVYLIAVHVRVVTVDKAWWTAVLGFFGFFVMLFNWIGVNFLLVGLHSYA